MHSLQRLLLVKYGSRQATVFPSFIPKLGKPNSKNNLDQKEYPYRQANQHRFGQQGNHVGSYRPDECLVIRCRYLFSELFLCNNRPFVVHCVYMKLQVCHYFLKAVFYSESFQLMYLDKSKQFY